jgi:signal transduction histidine kinase
MTTQSETAPMGSRVRDMLDHAPMPIWMEDWSAVAQYCSEQRASGATDLRAKLEADEVLLRSVIGKVVVIEANAKALAFFGATRPEDMLGPVPARRLTDDALRWMLNQAVVVWERGHEITCEVSGEIVSEVSTPGVEALASRIHWAAPCPDGSPDYSSVVVVVQDTTADKVAEREMQLLIDDVGAHLDASRQIEEHVHRLEALIDMSRSLASSFDLDVLLQLVVAIIRKVVGADRAVIGVVDTDKEEVVGVVGRGFPDGAIDGLTYPELMDGLCGRLVETRQAMVVPDLTAREVVGDLARRRTDVYLGGASAAAAPIVLDDMVLGGVAAISSRGREFTEMDLSLVRMIAAQAAVGLHNVELYGKLRRSRDEAHAAHQELQETQTQLLQAQKLEAIGSLAAGIAHEINTPIQFISDNASFIQESIGSLGQSFQASLGLVGKAADHPDLAADAAAVREIWEANDCAFLMEEIPDAVAETLEGAKRVAEIVRAMKDFAHPGSDSKHYVDINHVIRTTAQVSRNEWKYVAEMELELDDGVPQIPALAGPLGQSLLIMFVNSAQAMGEQGAGSAQEKGAIHVTTALRGDWVEIRVADTGPGIPADVVERIFDPFFTTKEVGKGSGQGLSIARSIIVDKHGGEISVEDGNPGAVFVIRLPVADPAGTPEAVASNGATA